MTNNLEKKREAQGHPYPTVVGGEGGTQRDCRWRALKSKVWRAFSPLFLHQTRNGLRLRSRREVKKSGTVLKYFGNLENRGARDGFEPRPWRRLGFAVWDEIGGGGLGKGARGLVASIL